MLAPWGEVEEGVRSGLGLLRTVELPQLPKPLPRYRRIASDTMTAVIVPCGHPLWLEAPVDPPWPGLLSGLEAFRQPLYRLG
jgi:hypothetical protein